MLCTLQPEAVPAPSVPWSSAEVFSLAAGNQINAGKPHQGVASKNPGLHQRFAACNSTTALGVSWGLWSGTASGATVTYEYDAFGNLLNSTGTTPNAYMYRGEAYDSDLGLYYLRARWMNPLTGRFMSRDPLDGDLTDPETLHKYLYAHGDPVNELDPSGMASIPYPAPAPAQTRPVRSASEYAGIILNISIRAIPAVAAVGCAVNIQYTVDALRTPGGSTKAIKLDLPECSAHKDCTPYEERIQEALAEVQGRYAELLADIHGLYGLYCKNPNATTQWGSWTGHLYAYEQAQLDLQNAIADAKDAGCPVSPEAEEWATKPPPSCPE